MMRAVLSVVAALGFTSSVAAQPASQRAGAKPQGFDKLREREMVRASHKHGVPLGMLYAVGLTETGRGDSLRPFALNVDGKAVYELSKPAAMQAFGVATKQGAKFIDVPYETAEEKEAAEGVGGYARPMPQSWLDRQKAEVAKRVAQADVVITTALIPGRPAPVLVTEDMVKSMKAGSVIVDLAAPQGGNCPLTVPGQTVQRHGVTLVGETNLPALVAADASSLYARNVLDFLKLVLPKAEAGADPGVKIDLEDDIVAACLMTQGGEVKRASK